MNQAEHSESTNTTATVPDALHPPVVVVSKDDLPLHCPMPDAPLWNSHPRVFIAIEEAGEAACPYCGTVYRLAE
ncbi:MAG TPA: zinc-finger domain-containing protein [Gammaproteobacteria bacterium]|nr:zinc-finger domain-containing protein [Gammaproteobacteria bacterium]